LVLALACSVLDLNDNHTIAPLAVSPREIPVEKNAFLTWYHARADREYYESAQKPYPVFIAAAAGGGLYAAYHTAITLARLQDRCPSFAQHVFAISGVSGGSLGAAVFSALAKQHAANGPHRECVFGPMEKGPLETQARTVLDRDFLAPLVAAALFPDFLQRFLPWRVEQFSRAKALDASIEEAWAALAEDSKAAAGSNPFSGPFLDHWDASGAAPALMLNTTDVNLGHRTVISPFWMQTGTLDFSSIWNLHSLVMDPTDPSTPIRTDLKLSTAVGLSARFPWVTPAGAIDWTPNPNEAIRIRLVDGGYFENSGIETATDLFNSIREYETASKDASQTKPHIRLHILPIGGYQKALHSVSNTANGFGEVASPARALLSSRDRRGYLAWYRWWMDRCDYDLSNPRCNFTASSLNHTDFRLPLGWRLSRLTRKFLDRHAGFADQTSNWNGEEYEFNSPNVQKRIFGILQENDEYACNAQQILAGMPDETLARLRNGGTPVAGDPSTEHMVCLK
jgi:hypothetical protein